jgi:hypothetical protein
MLEEIMLWNPMKSLDNVKYQKGQKESMEAE